LERLILRDQSTTRPPSIQCVHDYQAFSDGNFECYRLGERLWDEKAMEYKGVDLATGVPPSNCFVARTSFE
jgi:hypothetical protein